MDSFGAKQTVSIPGWLYTILAEQAARDQSTVDEAAAAYIGRGLFSGKEDGMTSVPTVSPTPIVDRETLGIDTVVVAAKAENFDQMFLNGYWSAIEMKQPMRAQVRYIAAYQKDAQSITHLAEITGYELVEGSSGKASKWKLTFSTPRKITPVRFTGGRGRAIQGREYTNRVRLEAARTIDDLRS